jgi:hypothetical protein
MSDRIINPSATSPLSGPKPVASSARWRGRLKAAAALVLIVPYLLIVSVLLMLGHLVGLSPARIDRTWASAAGAAAGLGLGWVAVAAGAAAPWLWLGGLLGGALLFAAGTLFDGGGRVV